MQRPQELAVGRRLLGHIDGRTTDLAADMFRNRVEAYSCRERARLERDKLFRERPIFMGLGTRLARPGDYLAEEVAGMPVLMARGPDGEMRAFANICRHRAAPVAEGCGNARAFVCPYHGWTYDLDGKLLGTTDRVGFAGLDLAGHGLARLPAAEKHGMMYVRPRPLAPGESAEIDIDRELGGFAADLAALRLDTYPIYSVDRIAPRINWKFAIDTFLEGYHIPHLHRKTIAPYFIGNCGTFDGAGLHGRMCVARTSIDKVRALPEDERDYRPHVISVYQLFPNTILIWQVDHIEIWRAFPGRDDAGRCDVEMTIYKPADSTRPDAYWEKNRDIAIRTVMEEDFPLGERMQIGFESGATEEVVYGRNEPCLVHFHSSIRNALGVAA
ncbi:MAG: aromatic ring-hydroxylating dioxygenase subunit alpha [Reyranella sp.]|uniref:aromatic ring-hydroxylating oxygenase subunit alpha n=1 Tax=Reyranella sp. TaxID=1929291 RepID=UPI003D11FA71